MRQHRSSTKSDDASPQARERRGSLSGGFKQRLPVLGGPGCWCGEPSDHDWPGKADGAPHPR